jgi:hypothetical protein
MSKHPMVRYLHHLIEEHGEDAEGGKAVALQLQLRGQLQGFNGALRVHPAFPELFEMLTVMQLGQPGSPAAHQAMAAVVFAAEDVANVVFIDGAGSMVEDRSAPVGPRRTPGGLVVG